MFGPAIGEDNEEFQTTKKLHRLDFKDSHCVGIARKPISGTK